MQFAHVCLFAMIVRSSADSVLCFPGFIGLDSTLVSAWPVRRQISTKKTW